MEYIYAALLLDAAGKEISEQNLESIVKAAGMSPDQARAKAIVESLKGVNIKDIIKNAQNVQAAAPAAHGGAAPEAKKEKPKEEEKKSEEEAASGLASLFG
ncbi:MAG: 50S ribosomal protein P1 [Candidatus Micrarchaeota archaeon]|nr:50S ribosomal protein P1 [Candidatus Micrarchaeota archaeon]MDE1804628.1 50S ribosomal protein P1 [Candidatus Micrarchaeota archaeon]MDE1846476.1 50S ribosomal protein P1 [Candidatus Micrarchaeota archaeon]